MWQNVRFVLPLFCGMTKQIFCHEFATRYRVLNGSFCLPNFLNTLNVLNSLTFLSHHIENRAFRKNREVWGIVFCVSKTRGVSSPFICYRFGKISKYIFTTGYANVTAYKKRACSPPIVAKSGGRFDCSFLKKGGGTIEHFAEKQPDNTQPLTFTRQRHITSGRTRRRVHGVA